MSEPHWTAYVQALATPLIACVAGAIASLIAYRQWQTAKSKVALDLFEKRLEIYENVSQPVFEIIQVGSWNIDQKITGRFARGLVKSKFLFGPEVCVFLEDIWRTILDLQSTGRAQTDRRPNQNFDATFRHEDELFKKINTFHADLDNLIFPYMRMDQKK